MMAAACGAKAHLQYNADGTFVMTHEAVASVSGDWRVVDGQLQLRLAGSPSFAPMQRITQDVVDTDAQTADAQGTTHTVLMLRSTHLPALAGTFPVDAHRS